MREQYLSGSSHKLKLLISQKTITNWPNRGTAILLAFCVRYLLPARSSGSILSLSASHFPALAGKLRSTRHCSLASPHIHVYGQGGDGCLSIIIKSATITKSGEANPYQLASPPPVSFTYTQKCRYLSGNIFHTNLTVFPEYSYIPPVIGAGKMIGCSPCPLCSGVP